MLHFAQEQTLELDGKKYRLPRYEYRLSQAFKEWIAEKDADGNFVRLPDLDIGGELFQSLRKEEQIERRKRAEQIANDLKCFHLNCELAREFLSTEPGIAKFWQIWLSKNHPDITEAEAFDVGLANLPRLQELMTKATGQAPVAGGRAGKVRTPRPA